MSSFSNRSTIYNSLGNPEEIYVPSASNSSLQTDFKVVVVLEMKVATSLAIVTSPLAAGAYFSLEILPE